MAAINLETLFASPTRMSGSGVASVSVSVVSSVTSVTVSVVFSGTGVVVSSIGVVGIVG